MKKRLLAPTCPVSFLFNVLWTVPPGDIQQKNNSVFVTACDGASTYDKMPLLLKADSIFTYLSELKYTSETFAGAALSIPHVFKLKV